ncbi:hypothetical protein AWH56_008775 [Anaerobacillus isosaccharinicus]|uniref:Uncharacterized protein n=1 Tax=Anaerobacillus isosaccharinicus TaxID=1532552 RepID=A0A1S2L114_9BACI|nr:hypothetical protein [Anaerobacillus isosaccharinicus]MBA5588934.1 hypothetical protein [Anaerobacillus isosaccharinicus]QOY37656.1 hypothetical protein AWH56_008775 [Anaerobacillus isosaccharinicus]
MKNVLTTWIDGDAIIFALPSHSLKGYGRTLVKCEMLGNDLFVTHECGVTKSDRNLSCRCTKTAVDAFLSIQPNVTFENVIYETKNITLQPTWEQVK